MNQDGKNLRGVLVGLGYQLAGGKDSAYSRPLGLAVEIFQTAILIHDDIIDHAFLRRGLPTIPYQVRQRYGKALGEKVENEAADIADSIGICAGDVGFYYANQVLCHSYGSDPNFSALMSYFCQMAVNTMYGEVLDIVLPFEEKAGIAHGPKEDSVMEIYHLKTAWYSVVGPLCLGMLLAGASSEQLRAMEQATNCLGLAFQIKDDIMGIFSQAKDLGKPITDICEYKQTLLYAYVHDKAPEQLTELKKHYEENAMGCDVIAKIRAIFTMSGARKYAEDKMEEFFQTAANSFKKMDFLKKKDLDLLMGLVQYLQLRTK